MNLREMTLAELFHEKEMWPGGTTADDDIDAELARRQAMLDAAGQVAQVVRDSVISGRTMDDGKLVACVDYGRIQAAIAAYEQVKGK